MSVVPTLNESEDRCLSLGRRTKPMPIKQLALQRGEEALTHGVVITVADGSHRWANAGLAAAAAEGDRCVLTSLIGVMDNSAAGSAPFECHVECGDNHLTPLVTLHRPSDDLAAPYVEDNSQVHEPGPNPDVGDISNPKLVRPCRREVPIHKVRCRSRATVAHGRGDPLSACNAHQALGPHQASDSLATNRSTLGPQLLMNARGSIGSSRPPIDRLHLRLETSIFLLPLGPAPSTPCVIPAGGDFQHAAHRGDGMFGPIRAHEFEDRPGTELVSRANQAAAFFRISRSSFSCRFSFRNSASSDRSDVVKPSSRRPSSRSACLAHCRIASAVGSNCRASSVGLRPARTISTSCRRKSFGYARCVFPVLLFLGIVTPLNSQVSTKPGQLHFRPWARSKDQRPRTHLTTEFTVAGD
jgi:hypothetical protein